VKKNIIFFAPYPVSKEKLADGYFARIKNIDDIFDADNRIYLHLSVIKNLKYKCVSVSTNLTAVEANVFFHYFKILKILKTGTVFYIQSLLRYREIIFFPIGKNKKIIWDVHGACPEENKFKGAAIKALINGAFESRLARRANTCVTVNNSMSQHIRKKYPAITASIVVLPLINKSFFHEVLPAQVDELRKELNIATEHTVFIYSGSLLKWQKFESVLQLIAKLHNPNYRFIILTGELAKAREIIAKYQMTAKIVLQTVASNKISAYYMLSHYGFMLRDKHILNEVATPTKLMEYMYYGLTPIVDYKNIGDFFDLGYEHVYFKDITDHMPKCKSVKNKQIINKILNNNQREIFRNLILSLNEQ
jgi:hypothetical protein